jgi:hypothetical protein
MRVTVTFADDELWRIRQLAAARGVVARASGTKTQKVDPSRSDVEIDMDGMLGEMAVAKFFAEQPCVTPGPDDGFDLYVGRWKAQIKTTRHQNGKLLMSHQEARDAHIAILCVIEDDKTVRLAGWHTGEYFIANAKEFKAYGASGYGLDQVKLRPIEQLLAGIRLMELRGAA